MKPYETDRLVHAFAALCDAKASAVHHREHREPGQVVAEWPNNERKNTQGSLRKAFPILDGLALETTKHFCEKLANEIEHLPILSIITQVDTILDVLEQELKQRQFFVLNLDNVRYFNNPTLAGECIRDKWGSANQELIDAGNCFALSEYRACVFHCCIACEAGLAALGKRLRVADQKSWHPWITKIRAALTTRFTGNRKRQFYAECANRLDSIRVGRRNPVSHFGLDLDPVYSEDDAKEILDSSCAFLRYFATELKPPR